MSASTTPADRSASQNEPQEPPRSVCEQYYARATTANIAGRAGAANGLVEPPGLKSTALAANSVRPTTEFRELMEEPPGGDNAGRAASSDPNVEGRFVALDVDAVQAHDFVRSGGWTIVTHSGGEWKRAGGTDHRGVLRGDEHVDERAVRAAVVSRLGFTLDEVQSVYRQGRLSNAQGELRAMIDARLLALSRAGAQVHSLGKALGLGMAPGGDGGEFCPAVRNALRRATAAELQTEGSS